ncbi:unnamed protein product [Paramecium pentaurelia]|uniref:Uncharacterized protein n=1 Tax=Paramecium pentaurelia TaxID=43138 RepID=A0A8S1WL78_9CILI|nr:unnamed protein product [Paramecium pentaurelia]
MSSNFNTVKNDFNIFYIFINRLGDIKGWSSNKTKLQKGMKSIENQSISKKHKEGSFIIQILKFAFKKDKFQKYIVQNLLSRLSKSYKWII